MTGLTAGDVRQYLSGIAAGRLGAEPGPAFGELSQRGAVTGTSDAPVITDVGRHVLKELELRAYRVDAWPLDHVAARMGSALSALDSAALNAEYLLGEIGPLTPAPALPYLRVSAAGLATRQTRPEELAEEFRNTWGMVEVLEGDPRDRLLTAELLTRSEVPPSRIYAPLTHTAEALSRDPKPPKSPIAIASILHLYPTPSPIPRLEEWPRWRSEVRSEEAAALLAGRSAPDLLERVRDLKAGLAPGGSDAHDIEHAAVYLALVSARSRDDLPRVLELARALQGRLPTPLIAAALLTARHHRLSPAELIDWVDKAVAIARSRRLAPTEPELVAIAVALLHGIPPGEFQESPLASLGGDEEGADLRLTIVTLHAWVYRAILDPSVPAPAAVARTERT
jgi:hypothetical protein